MPDKRIVVYPWSMDSEPGRRLSEALNAIRVYGHKNYHPRPGDFIIDWGRSDAPSWAAQAEAHDCVILNKWTNIKKSVDKLRSFAHFKKAGVRTVPWTENPVTAENWLANEDWVCARTMTDSYDGKGLVLCKNSLAWAPLYTKFIPSNREFRAYVFRNKIIEFFEKLPEAGAKKDIRTDSNGWYYEWADNYGIDMEPAIEAIKALGLDFGGVDMILSKTDGKTYVLETNTAPDIYKHTATKFAAEIKKLYDKESA